METEYLSLYNEGALKPQFWVLGSRQTDVRLIRIGKTLRGRFDRDIYSPPATVENAAPLGHTHFQLNIFLNPTHPSICAPYWD